MKAAFILVPSESRRLIAKGVAAMKEIKDAEEKGYTIICGGTTNGYVAQEILGVADIPPPKIYGRHHLQPCRMYDGQ